MDFNTIDVLNDSGGREQLLSLGAQSVPVLAKDGQFIFCQNMEDVAEFVGLQGSGHSPLPPAVLVCKMDHGAARRAALCPADS